MENKTRLAYVVGMCLLETHIFNVLKRAKLTMHAVTQSIWVSIRHPFKIGSKFPVSILQEDHDIHIV